MTKRIAIVLGHPDPTERHLLHALADAYAEGAVAGGHDAASRWRSSIFHCWARKGNSRREQCLPGWSRPARHALGRALAVPVSALALNYARFVQRGFSKQIFRPGFAMEYGTARIVVTKGIPAPMYRWYFGAFGVRGFERSVLGFACIKPARESLYGLTFADERKRARWLEDMRRHGERGD